MDPETDYYELLGLLQSASLKDIDTAYKKASLRHHPDRNLNSPTAHEEFITVRKAYETLKDPKERLLYNNTLENRPTNTDPKPWEISEADGQSDSRHSHTERVRQEHSTCLDEEQDGTHDSQDQAHKDARLLSTLEQRIKEHESNLTHVRNSLTNASPSDPTHQKLDYLRASVSEEYIKTLIILDSSRQRIIRKLHPSQRQTHLNEVQRDFEKSNHELRQKACKEVLELLALLPRSKGNWTCEFRWDWLQIFPLVEKMVAVEGCMEGPWHKIETLKRWPDLKRLMECQCCRIREVDRRSKPTRCGCGFYVCWDCKERMVLLGEWEEWLVGKGGMGFDFPYVERRGVEGSGKRKEEKVKCDGI